MAEPGEVIVAGVGRCFVMVTVRNYLSYVIAADHV
jgi:hypothetical protein